MRAPNYLLEKGVRSLPCVGDGRQSGTSGSPSILNASPEAAAGGGLAILKNGDKVRIDLNKGTCDMLISADEIAKAQGGAREGRRLQGAAQPDTVAGNLSQGGGPA